jgi:hypothetical protein
LPDLGKTPPPLSPFGECRLAQLFLWFGPTLTHSPLIRSCRYTYESPPTATWLSPMMNCTAQTEVAASSSPNHSGEPPPPPCLAWSPCSPLSWTNHLTVRKLPIHSSSSRYYVSYGHGDRARCVLAPLAAGMGHPATRWPWAKSSELCIRCVEAYGPDSAHGWISLFSFSRFIKYFQKFLYTSKLHRK